MHNFTDAHLQPASEMAGELKTMSSVLFVINCNICQKESRTCKHFREKMAYLSCFEVTKCMGENF